MRMKGFIGLILRLNVYYLLWFLCVCGLPSILIRAASNIKRIKEKGGIKQTVQTCMNEE